MHPGDGPVSAAVVVVAAWDSDGTVSFVRMDALDGNDSATGTD